MEEQKTELIEIGIESKEIRRIVKQRIVYLEELMNFCVDNIGTEKFSKLDAEIFSISKGVANVFKQRPDIKENLQPYFDSAPCNLFNSIVNYSVPDPRVVRHLVDSGGFSWVRISMKGHYYPKGEIAIPTTCVREKKHEALEQYLNESCNIIVKSRAINTYPLESYFYINKNMYNERHLL